MIKKITLLCVIGLCTLQVAATTILNTKTSSTNPNSFKKKEISKELDSILKTRIVTYDSQTSEFNEDYIAQNFSLDSVTNKYKSQAIAVMDKLKASQNFVNLLSPKDMVSLPVGVKKEIGNSTYILGISSARFTPEYTEVTAFVKITTLQTDAQGNQKQLFFGAEKIKLSHKGGIYGDVNLVLLGDVPIPINGGSSMIVLKGGFDMKKGDVKKATYVTINCGGFKELGITADVLFSRKILEPVDANYKVIPNKKVTGSFKTIASDWNDILVEIDLPRFQMTKKDTPDTGKGIAGLIFEVNTAVFDFSDIRNSSSVVFPEGYEQNLIPGYKELWRGVYINNLTVVLPEQFKIRKSTKRVEFKASNLLIDGLGVSGNFSVDHLLPLDKGTASGWQFSVDHIEASFVANNLIGAGFGGKIVLPITKGVTAKELKSKDSIAINKKTLSYGAIIDPVNEDYLLNVQLQDSISFNLFKARGTLTANSYVDLRVTKGRFRPKAVLHGNLAIKGSNNTSDPNKGTVDFEGIIFQNLQLQTEAPYFQVDNMGYNGEVKLGNFPVTISDIYVTANNTQASLRFGLDINLMGGTKGFSGKTNLAIIGKFNNSSGLHKWSFDRIDLEGISIDADLGKVEMRGMLEIKDDDPIYGDGFYGELGATFNGISVDATAWFGKTDFRYWYVDAFADLSGMNPPVQIGVLGINGFGGGAYYRMTKSPTQPMPIYNGEPVKMAPNKSGLDYKPDADAGLGFRALLGFSLANEKAFNGKVGFEMAFNRHGGLNRILFFGEAHIVKALDFKFGDKFKAKLAKLENKINDLGENNPLMQSLKESNLVEYSKVAFPQDGLSFDVGIDANFSMEMDFRNKTFHATMEAFVNTPGGFFRGVGPKGRAGWAVFHTGPGEWYLHMGTPKDRIGLKVGIGSFNVQATTYLMIGDNIPGSPPPPDIVAQILGTDTAELDYMRDLNALGSGRGFAFGADLSIDTGEMKFLIFYARFQAGLGFDIMVKDYGDTACKGRGQIGIDGWYANGQAYAYLQGELGIHIKLFLVRKKIPIIKAGAAVLLQTKLPNPAWFRGYVGGHFNLLGGLVKGRFRFKLEIGDECEVVGGGGAPLGGLKIISDIKPSDGDANIDVFSVPQAVFNMRVNTPFELEDDEGIKTYRILLDEYSVTSNGVAIKGDIAWNENNDMVNYKSFDVFPPNTAIQIKVVVSFQELRGGSWIVLTQDGKPAKEIEEITFTTGEAPGYIPLTNIVYCYPVIDQDYFYKEERTTGYIKLVQGQPYLFAQKKDWVQEVRFESDSGTEVSTGLSYDTSERMVNFNIPDLKNQKEYAIRMVSMPSTQANYNNSSDDNYTSQNIGQEGNTLEVRNKQAQTVLKEQEEVELLDYNFTTSAYDTFAQKIQDKKATKYYSDPIYSDVHALETAVQASERFSLLELNGGKYTVSKPLVTTEAILDDAYFRQAIYPLIYQGYPLQPKFTVNRDITKLGLPPKKGLSILTWYSSYLENDTSHSLLDTRIPYRYYLPFHYKQDFVDIQYKIVNAYLKKPLEYQRQIQQYNHIINGVFPSIYPGNYKVKMQYVLPGGIQGSSAIFTYNNPY